VSQLTSSKVRQERSQYRVPMRQAIEKQAHRGQVVLAYKAR
jgi:hypothetical protein